MSVEDLKKYGKMCADDPDVRKKAKEIGMEDVDGQITYAKQLGLTFTKEDLEALAKEAGLSKKDELSEEDLEKVAGGFVSTTALLVGSAVVGAAAGVVAAGAAVTSTTSNNGW